MNKNRGVIICIGIFFGFIAFAITSFFFSSPLTALELGVLTAAIYIFVLSIVNDISLKKYENIDSTIEQDIIMKDNANYYGENLVVNGILFLTADRLIFISFEKKPVYREEILLSNIKRATYGKVAKFIYGIKLFMNDSTVKGFALKEIEPFLEHINKVLNPSAFE